MTFVKVFHIHRRVQFNSIQFSRASTLAEGGVSASSPLWLRFPTTFGCVCPSLPAVATPYSGPFSGPCTYPASLRSHSLAPTPLCPFPITNLYRSSSVLIWYFRFTSFVIFRFRRQTVKCQGSAVAPHTHSGSSLSMLKFL